MKLSKEKRGKAEKEKFLKIISIIFFISIVIFAFGCKKEAKKEEVALGLNMKFVENTPPDSISVGKQIPIFVDVQNTGSYEVPPNRAQFYLKGIGNNLKDYSNKLQNSNPLLSSGQERLIFATQAFSDLSLQNPFTLNMVLESCYDYATITQATICIAKQSGAICSLEGNKIGATSNTLAPIKISSLTESVIGDELNVEFIIENAGKGKLYLPNTNCDALMQETPLEIIKENTVKININDGGVGLKCKLLTEGLSSIEGLNGFARLGKISCKKKISDENTQAVLQISTEYKYRDSLSKQLTIYPA